MDHIEEEDETVYESFGEAGEGSAGLPGDFITISGDDGPIEPATVRGDDCGMIQEDGDQKCR